MRTIDWADGAIELIDQTLLPGELVIRRVTTLGELIDDIQRLAVRGAPALGVAGALGVALLAHEGDPPEAVRRHAARLRAARPTAVNLAWGVDRALARLGDGPAAVLAEALAIRDQDISACVAMGARGADLIRGMLDAHDDDDGLGYVDGFGHADDPGEAGASGRGRPARVMTVCNTGGLAAVERGTALGVVQTLHERGQLELAYALETRPLLQGARLTAWELERMGAPYRLLVDSAGAFLLSQGIADVVLIGADRIAANGDTANKVGSYALALAARAAHVPFLVVAPESTIDPSTRSGKDIEIEDRGADEVVRFAGVRVAPEGAQAVNPAFDVTPAKLITAIVTERRVIRCHRGEWPI
ncbi:MAG: s-methyl-5-thioribose-1-phosphate isomerase [Austwickia sp.]|nr:s-methyl-5-thioribose-1-phosphate isomerase [Austwickia sp.]